MLLRNSPRKVTTSVLVNVLVMFSVYTSVDNYYPAPAKNLRVCVCVFGSQLIVDDKDTTNEKTWM